MKGTATMMSQFLFLLLTCMGDLSAPRTLRIFIYLEVVLFAEIGIDGIERAASQQLVMVLAYPASNMFSSYPYLLYLITTFLPLYISNSLYAPKHA